MIIRIVIVMRITPIIIIIIIIIVIRILIMIIIIQLTIIYLVTRDAPTQIDAQPAGSHNANCSPSPIHISKLNYN